MVFQQFGGINGVCFYVSNIFESAGKEVLIKITIKGEAWPLSFPTNRELTITFCISFNYIYVHPTFKSLYIYTLL